MKKNKTETFSGRKLGQHATVIPREDADVENSWSRGQKRTRVTSSRQSERPPAKRDTPLGDA